MSIESKEEILRAVDSALEDAWATESLKRLHAVAKMKKWVTIDDLWKVIDEPTGDRAKVGAIMKRATNKNLEKNPHGVFLKGTAFRVFSEKDNHDNIMLWESTIYTGTNDKMPDIVTRPTDPDLDLTNMVKVYKAAKKYHDSGWSYDVEDDLTDLLRDIFSDNP